MPTFICPNCSKSSEFLFEADIKTCPKCAAVFPTPTEDDLYKARAEIDAIYKKYDIGGFHVTVSPHDAKFSYQLTPTWSVVTIENNNYIRFKALKADFATPEDRNKATAYTITLLSSVSDLGTDSAEKVRHLLNKLSEHLSFESYSQPKEDKPPV